MSIENLMENKTWLGLAEKIKQAGSSPLMYLYKDMLVVSINPTIPLNTRRSAESLVVLESFATPLVLF